MSPIATLEPPATRRPAASPTTYAVLGLLAAGDTSGYDLVKHAEEAFGLFWIPAKSHVYTELRRLADLGWASEREVDQLARPDKRVYEITTDGREALAAWLTDTGYQHEPARSTFLLKLYFGSARSGGTIRERVQAFRDETVRLIAALEARTASLGRASSTSGPSLVLSFGLAQARAMLAWSDETLARLPKGRGRSR